MGLFVPTSYFKVQILTGLKIVITADDYDGILVPANVSLGLLTNVVAPNQDTVLADLVPPTFGGYALTPLTSWSVIRREVDGMYSILSNSIPFYCTGSPYSDTITGVYLVNNVPTPDVLLGVQMFTSPYPIAGVATGFNFSVEIGLAAMLTLGEGTLA